MALEPMNEATVIDGDGLYISYNFDYMRVIRFGLVIPLMGVLGVKEKKEDLRNFLKK